MSEEYLIYLKENLDNIEWYLGGTPYIFVCCDDEFVRCYFTKEIKKKIKPLVDYSLDGSGEEYIKEQLTNNHVLLLDFEKKVEEYKAFLDEQDLLHYGKIKEREKGTEECYGLIRFREHFYRLGNWHTIVIVGNRELHRKIVWCLPDLSSVSEFILVDDEQQYLMEKVKQLKKD